eukprot:c20913_g1_i2 orf=138-1178(+)
MASSIEHIHTPVKTEEEQQSNTHTFFTPDEELGSASCRASSLPIKHGNAERGSHLVHFGAVSVGGIANAHTFFNSENIDPRSGSASVALSIQSTARLGRAKVGKRKSSRGSSKVPIKVFSADTANFMAMVHNLTGLPSAPYLLGGSSQNSLLKPLPARPLHPYMQGMYTPGASAFPACDKVSANSSADDGFSSAFSQLKSSLGQSQQHDSFNNVSIATKQGSNTGGCQSSTDRFPPSIYNLAFKALHSQVLQNSNSVSPSSGVSVSPSPWDPKKEDSQKEKPCTDSFNEHKMLNEDISGEGNGTGNLDWRASREASNWKDLVAGEVRSLVGMSALRGGSWPSQHDR